MASQIAMIGRSVRRTIFAQAVKSTVMPFVVWNKLVIPSSYRGDSNSSSSMRLFAASAAACMSLMLSQTKSASNDSDQSIHEKNPATKVLSTAFMKELRTLLRSEQINVDVDDCKDRGKPWNSYHAIDVYPQVIVHPESTSDVSKILQLCNQHKVPVVAFGGGTSLEGQTLASGGGVSLDMNGMARVLQVNAQDLDCTVQAGLGYQELNRILKEEHKVPIWFPLDPGPGASIGGMCACRCSGSTAVRYGSMRDNVLNVTAVLPDGQVIKTGSRARKCSAGYDLTRLLIGSEGTLAVITEVTLKLHGIPQFSSALRVSFKDIKDAAATARDTLNCGVVIGRCELMDAAMVKITNLANSGTPADQWSEAHTLMYEVTGPSEAAVTEQLQIVTAVAERNRGFEVRVARSAEECTALWKARKEALWSIMAAYPDKQPMITDVCVPLSRLPDLIEIVRAEIEKTSLPCPIVAHAGDGNIHVIVMMDSRRAEEVREAKQLLHFMGSTAIQMGGTCTGEHGVGAGKMDLLEEEMGPGSIQAMQRIKREFDPNNIMNPGKVLRMEKRSSSGESSAGDVALVPTFRLC